MKDKFELEVIKKGGYEVRIRKYVEDGYQIVDIICPDDMPRIFAVCDGDTGEILGYEIQTTSYGALKVEELAEVIKKYEKAMDIVKQFSEE